MKNLINRYCLVALMVVMSVMVSCDKGSDSPDVSVYPTWMEIPTIENVGDMKVITHYCPIGGSGSETVRSYTMLYDPVMYTSYWVAYPLHSSYFGEIERSKYWYYDPKVPEQYQISYADRAGFNNGKNTEAGYGTNYDRGHQIPSNDRRANRTMNNQTFYATNATPQNASLNSGKWSRFENLLHDKVKDNLDTLWQVTGACFQDRTSGVERDIDYVYRSTKDGAGADEDAFYYSVRVPKPNYYFKVAICENDGNPIAIGFWVENKANTGSILPSEIYSIEDIEAKTGFEFFPRLDPELSYLKSLTVDEMKSAWGI